MGGTTQILTHNCLNITAVKELVFSLFVLLYLQLLLYCNPTCLFLIADLKQLRIPFIEAWLNIIFLSLVKVDVKVIGCCS